MFTPNLTTLKDRMLNTMDCLARAKRDGATYDELAFYAHTTLELRREMELVKFGKARTRVDAASVAALLR